MASDIELIIFDGTTPLAGVPAHASVVALSGVLRAIAGNEALVASLTADGEDCDAIRPGWTLRVCVCRLAQKLSADRWVLYVAAETFGGPGTQEGAAWHEGQTAYGPSGTCDIPRTWWRATRWHLAQTAPSMSGSGSWASISAMIRTSSPQRD